MVLLLRCACVGCVACFHVVLAVVLALAFGLFCCFQLCCFGLCVAALLICRPSLQNVDFVAIEHVKFCTVGHVFVQ